MLLSKKLKNDEGKTERKIIGRKKCLQREIGDDLESKKN